MHSEKIKLFYKTYFNTGPRLFLVVGIDQFVALTLLGLDAVLLENVNLEHVQDGSLDVLRPHLLALGEDDLRDHAVSKNINEIGDYLLFSCL